MPREGVGIKVKIGLKLNGRDALYPNWDNLPLAKTGTPESHQIVKWEYEKTFGHKEDNGGDSPVGVQWGMMIVTEQFADEAVAMYPTVVKKMTAPETETFWDTRVMAHIDDNLYDSKTINDLLSEITAHEVVGSDINLITVLKNRLKNAIDPDHAEKGIKKNKRKNIADAKANWGFTLKP